MLQVSGPRKQATTWNERHIVFEKLLREQNVICNTIEVERFSSIHDFAVMKELLHEKFDEFSDCDAFSVEIFGLSLLCRKQLQEENLFQRILRLLDMTVHRIPKS